MVAREQSGKTTHLAQLSAGKLVCVARLLAWEPVMSSPDIGEVWALDSDAAVLNSDSRLPAYRDRVQGVTSLLKLRSRTTLRRGTTADVGYAYDRGRYRAKV